MNNLNNMICLDVFLNSLSKEEYDKIKHNIKPLKNKPHPLLCWDIASHGFYNVIKSRNQNLQPLKVIFKKYNWQFDWNIFNEVFYETVVLTDLNKQIKWVDNGFFKMTGYPKNFALGKKPTFLQGEKTDTFISQRINEKLFKGIVFSERIINYKKDGTEYLCAVSFFPVRDISMNISAFLALEKQVI